MSGLVPRRQRLRRLALRALPLVALAVLSATLAGALQVRSISVSGVRRFRAQEVEHVLRTALGTPTVAARAEALRDQVLRIGWVEDAQVRVSLDGVVSCTLVERVPVAVAVSNGRRTLVDVEGRLLGPAGGEAMLEIEGYEAQPVDRGALLGRVGELEAAWGSRLVRATRRGPRDAELSFENGACPVLCDPDLPSSLHTARRVLAAWVGEAGRPPLRIDVRVSGRAAVLPAPEPVKAEEAS